jgi:bifunctional ADP-heptose synthase (sugar kinase/adenylyltransferase)
MKRAELTWKDRRMRALALKAELKLDVATGKLIERSHVVREWKTRVVQTKNQLLGLGREFAPRLMGKSPQEIQALIDARVCEILRALAHEEYAPDAGSVNRT